MKSTFDDAMLSASFGRTEGQAADLRNSVRGLGQSSTAGLTQEQKNRRLRDACEGFESIFIQKMWQQMRATLPKEGLLKGREEAYWQDMYDQELAKSMTSAGGIGLAPLNSVIFAFLGDVVEYGQWKTHVRSESLVFAGGSFGAKVGSGISTAIMTYLLQFAGYVSSSSGSAVQPQSAIDMIVDIYMYGPIIVWIIVIAGLFLYKLDKMYPIIMKDLILREERGEL